MPGYTQETYDLTVQLTRIMFPGIGFLVLSAWCLGVLNSHRQFFLSYVAPVLWNVAQIVALVAGVLVVGGYETLDQKEDLAVALAWGVLVGGILQFGVQIGPVRRLLGEVPPQPGHERTPGSAACSAASSRCCWAGAPSRSWAGSTCCWPASW